MWVACVTTRDHDATMRLWVLQPLRAMRWVSGHGKAKGHVCHGCPRDTWWSGLQPEATLTYVSEGALAPPLASPQHCHAGGFVSTGATMGTALRSSALLSAWLLAQMQVEKGSSSLGGWTEAPVNIWKTKLDLVFVLFCFGGSQRDGEWTQEERLAGKHNRGPWCKIPKSLRKQFHN